MTSRLPTLPLLLALGGACARPLPAPSVELDPSWYDGRAELASYEWRVSRYGEERRGEAVAILVTEPFSSTRHVKVEADDPQAVTVLKLNLMRDFRTGIYDYDTMLSTFVRVSDLAPLKVAFSSAEWCGQVYEQLDLWGDRIEHRVHSYFEGESADLQLGRPGDGLLEDELLVWLRGLGGAPLGPGESRLVPVLESSFLRRLEHRPARWLEAVLARAPEPVTVEVPDGSHAALRYEVRLPGRTGTFHVERAAPHRILAWRWERDGRMLEEARLVGSRRLAYWEHNGADDEPLADHLRRTQDDPNR